MRFGNITPRPLITGLSILRHVLGKSFVDPTRNRIGVKSMQNQMRDFVTKRVVGKLVSRVSLNEQAAGRVDAASPALQLAGRLKLVPLFWVFEDINVTLR